MVVVLAGVSLTGFSQESNKQKPERIKLVPSTHSNENSQQTKLSPAEEIKNCEEQIEALDTKEAWIRNNPEETKMATENGWFVNAEETRVKLRARIKELEK